MVSSVSGVQSANTVANFTLSPPTSSDSTDSFAQQLLTTIEGYLKNPASGSQLDVTISSVPGQNSGSSQFLVTVTNEPASGSTGTTGTGTSGLIPSGPAPSTPTSTATPATPVS